MHLSRRSRRHGLSRCGIVLTLAAGAIVLGLLLPALQHARAQAATSNCENNLKMLALAVANCADSQRGLMPPAAGSYPRPEGSEGSIFAHLLPYLEETPLYNSGLTGAGNFSVWTGEIYSKPVKSFLCPQDKSGGKDHLYQGWLATGSYAANFQVFGNPAKNSMQGRNRFPVWITDGTSNTIEFTERFQLCAGEPNAWAYSGASPWTPVFGYYSKDLFQVAPKPGVCDPNVPQTPHTEGLPVGMADGSARVVSLKLSEATWKAACTPNAGEVLGPDW